MAHRSLQLNQNREERGVFPFEVGLFYWGDLPFRGNLYSPSERFSACHGYPTRRRREAQGIGGKVEWEVVFCLQPPAVRLLPQLATINDSEAQ